MCIVDGESQERPDRHAKIVVTSYSLIGVTKYAYLTRTADCKPYKVGQLGSVAMQTALKDGWMDVWVGAGGDS